MKIEKAYKNIEDIITCGFLYRGIYYDNNIIILKTISDKEYRLLPLYVAQESVDAIIYRLAFSTLMINGFNVLMDRNENIPELFNFYNSLSVVSLNNLVENSNKIYNEYLESLEFLEGFCYTEKSRVLWKVLSGRDVINSGSYYGILGSESLGLNTAQESWIVINKQLDVEDDYNTQFRLSLMITSAFSGKGAQTIERSYEAHKKELEELREEIAKYGQDKKRVIAKQHENNGWASALKSREDIVRELNREMSGNKDKHDMFVDSWIKKQRDAAEEAKKAAEEKQKAFRKKLETDIDLTKMEDSRVATPEEIAKLKKKKVIHGIELPSDPLEKKYKKEDVLRKIGGTIIK